MVKKIIRDVLISSFIVLVLILAGILFLKVIIKNDVVAGYIMDELFSNNGKGLMIVFIGIVTVMLLALSIVEASNRETEKNKLRYKKYKDKQREDENKAVEIKENEKSTTIKKATSQNKNVRNRRDVTDNYIEQQLSELYEQRNKRNNN